MEQLTIDALVQETQQKIPAIITQLPKNIYQLTLHELAENARNTAEQVRYFQAYECALAVFSSAALTLRKKMDILTLEQRLAVQRAQAEEGKEQPELQKQQTEITDAIMFSNRYALAFAGHIGLALLESAPAVIENQYSFGAKQAASKEREDLIKQVTQMNMQDMQLIYAAKKTHGEKPGDDELKHGLEAIFTSWIYQFNWNSFKDVTEWHKLEEISLKYNKYTLQAGKFKSGEDRVIVDERFVLAKREDVIGSEDFVRKVWRNLVKLGCYDTERGQNPHNVRTVIFTHGAPGCGKTYVSNALIRSFAEIRREKGLPLWAFTHSTTDYASHYQNQTANRLAELVQDIRNFQGPVIMYIADADNIFQSRKDPRLTAEQQQTLAVYFKMFDGSLIPKNGKFMAIMDANYIDGIDDATKSRLFDEVLELERYNKPEEFAEYARRKVTKGLDGLTFPAGMWGDLGAYLLATPLSNREIDHVIGGLRGDYDVPEEQMALTWEEKKAYGNEQMRKLLTPERIREAFEFYIKNRMEIERKALEAKHTDDRYRFLDYLEQKANPTAEELA